MLYIALSLLFFSALSFSVYYLAPAYMLGRGIIIIGMYVCVCPSVNRFSQKVTNWYWWNLARWCIMIRGRFLSKMGLIGKDMAGHWSTNVFQALWSARFGKEKSQCLFTIKWGDDVVNNYVQFGGNSEQCLFSSSCLHFPPKTFKSSRLR